MKLIYKLQIWLYDDETNTGEFRDFYFDVNKITGWFVPTKEDNITDDAINIFFEGEMVSIRQEEHILEYLANNFGHNAITNKTKK